jgi:uncharacterized protein
MQTLIYLHGFRSAAASKKAHILSAALQHVRGDWEYITPNLSFDPALAFQQIESIILRQALLPENITLVGSSLGGFYATAMAEKYGCRAVLLNPSLKPHETLAAHVGPQTNLYLDESFTFTLEHLAVLRAAAFDKITEPQRYLVIVEMGDELLNHHHTIAQFAGAEQIVVAGGNHDLASFPTHIAALLRFAQCADTEI